MGSWTSFRIDGYSLLSTRSYVENQLMALFREEDKLVRQVATRSDGAVCATPWATVDQMRGWLETGDDGTTYVVPPEGSGWEIIRGAGGTPVSPRGGGESDRSASAPGATVERLDAPLQDAGVQHVYRAPAWVVRDRLDAMGFSLRAAREEFERGNQGRLQELLATREAESYQAEWWGDEELELIKRVDFDSWLEAFGQAKTRGLQGIDHSRFGGGSADGSYLPADQATPPLRLVLGEHADTFFGFRTGDLRYLVRAALATCADDALVEQDLSDVTNAGNYAIDEPVSDQARRALVARHPLDAPIIVLTQGAIDRRAIRASLELLYPHLADLYRFVSFEGMGAAEGPEALAASVKTFALAEITNRVVALFANDAAAGAALDALDPLSLPLNIMVAQYPTMAIAGAYPTVGPGGAATMDVNGLAGCIELYFGEDILRDEQGALVPVEWRELDAEAGRYDGDVTRKSELRSRFEQKLERCTESEEALLTADWSGMQGIVEAIRTAFS